MSTVQFTKSGTLFSMIREIVADTIYPEGRERRQLAEREASTCALTGLANKRAFLRAQPAAEDDADTYFIVFDANHFKQVNDECGHDAGDAMLVSLASAIARAASRFGLRERCFRIGGDEFAVLSPVHVAEAVASEAEREFGEHEVCDGVRVSVSATCGATFKEADMRLKGRKDARKGRAN